MLARRQPRIEAHPETGKAVIGIAEVINATAVMTDESITCLTDVKIRSAVEGRHGGFAPARQTLALRGGWSIMQLPTAPPIGYGLSEPDGCECLIVKNGPLNSAETMTKVLVADDHPLFREALHSAINAAYPNVETVDAINAANALELLNAGGDFDLVLLDLNMPETHGFEGLLQIRGKFPRLPVVVVSGYEDTRVITESLSYGAAGFIPKSSRRIELVAAIQAVMNGAVYVPPGYSPELETPEDNRRKEIIGRLSTLTPQQLRVLHMLRKGLLNKQIAYEMEVGETTVKAHVSEILRKLHVYSRTQAVIEVSKADLPDFLASDVEALHAGDTSEG